MEHITIGREYNVGKVAFAECSKDDPLDKINIKDNCYLLIILTYGKLEFEIGGERIIATAPSFVCFDESENPILISKQNARYTCVYFHPKFLNINMTFELLRSTKYSDIASNHDMFMLKPFIDKAYVIPIAGAQVEKIEQSAVYMAMELTEQRDWYWSCRGRSYFMEVIIALERMYGLIGYGLTHHKSDKSPIIKNPKLRDAVLYIEGHYRDNLTLSDISASAGLNHTTLTALMKEELGCTAIEYLMQYRITVAKKQLAFTEVPIKDIADLVGFKTVQHFNRIFKDITGRTPAEFRKSAVDKRKEELLMPIHLEGRRKELELMWQENLQKNGDNPHKSLQISIKALEEYPSDETFLHRAAMSEEWLADEVTDTNDISKWEHLSRSVKYAKRILDENPNSETAKEFLVRVYSKMGADDMAIEQAYKCKNTDLALKLCLKGDDLRRHRQKIISRKLHDLLCEILWQDIKDEYTLDVCEKIVNLFIPDGNYQNFYHILDGIYFKRAKICLEKGDEKAAINTLQKIFQIAKSTAEITRTQKHFTSPLFNLLEDNTPFCAMLGYVEMFLICIKREFASLENNEEFLKILEDANTYVAEFRKSSVEKRKDEIK